MTGQAGESAFRLGVLYDVCKHCETAGCLEACPTGAICFGQKSALSMLQDDVCNGSATASFGWPVGVI